MFNNKRRIASAWAKGLMLGKAVGARDERDRIIEIISKSAYSARNGQILETPQTLIKMIGGKDD